MINFKRKAALVAAAAVMALGAAGCNGSGSGDSSQGGTSRAESAAHQNDDIQLKSYKYPEFLNKYCDSDMLAKPVYTSFDAAAILVEPKDQPFSDYKCTACFNDIYYIYTDDSHYGLLDQSGNVLLDAANIKNISAVSPCILQLKYESGETAYFQADANGAQLVDIGDFDSSRITFAPQAADESSGSDTKSTYIMQLDGAPIYDTVWTSAKPADKSEIKTSRKFEAAYKAVSAAGTYYITFDKYYNFCVYEAAYGFVSLKIGGEYGESYIFGSKDYSELETLIASFGRENSANTPTKDDNADYIQFTLGLQNGQPRTMTLSSDGYCFTDFQLDKDGGGNKYFSVLSRETFVDLVNWVNVTLNK